MLDGSTYDENKGPVHHRLQDGMETCRQAPVLQRVYEQMTEPKLSWPLGSVPQPAGFTTITPEVR